MKEAAKQLHAHLKTDAFKRRVVQFTKNQSHFTIQIETELFIKEEKLKWLNTHDKTIFLEQAKTVLKEDFFDILETLVLPGKDTENSMTSFKKLINPLLALVGSGGIGAGYYIFPLNPPAGIALGIGGSALGGFLLSYLLTDSEKECQKALQNITEESLRKYIYESKQEGINECMNIFFEDDVIKKIRELNESIRQTRVEIDKNKTQKTILKVIATEISRFSERLKDIK